MSKIKGIDHIAIAVKDLNKAVEAFNKLLDSKPEVIEEVPEEGVRIAMFKVGNAFIELLEPLSPDSTLAKFLEKRGEGIHHIALRVKDITEAMDHVRRAGLKLIYGEAREVARGNRKINFIHPKSLHGVLLELVERIKKGE